MSRTNFCVTDCNEGQGAYCGGLANPVSDDLFENPRSCCEQELAWRFIEFCEADSLLSQCYAGTGKYYRGDTAGAKVCVRDCDPTATGDSTCGGLVEDDWIVLHDSPEDCCSMEYDWMTNQLCVARTTQTNASVFWPDKTNENCVLDSETPAQDLSVPVYSLVAECCDSDVSWVSKEVCLTASGYSTVVSATNKFFVDWDDYRCILDSEGSAKSPQKWDDTHDTITECCKKQLWWVPPKTCAT